MRRRLITSSVEEVDGEIGETVKEVIREVETRLVLVNEEELERAREALLGAVVDEARDFHRDWADRSLVLRLYERSCITWFKIMNAFWFAGLEFLSNFERTVYLFGQNNSILILDHLPRRFGRSILFSKNQEVGSQC